MPASAFSTARVHLALVAGCLLVAAYLPAWQKLWFVAESGRFGGSRLLLFFLLLGLFRQWRPALGLTYAWLVIQLTMAGYILFYNLATGGPTLGFFLTNSLHLAAGLLLYCSPSLNRYLKSQAAGEAA